MLPLHRDAVASLKEILQSTLRRFLKGRVLASLHRRSKSGTLKPSWHLVDELVVVTNLQKLFD